MQGHPEPLLLGLRLGSEAVQQQPPALPQLLPRDTPGGLLLPLQVLQVARRR